jgi:hypothetical protein
MAGEEALTLARETASMAFRAAEKGLSEAYRPIVAMLKSQAVAVGHGTGAPSAT